MAINGLGLSFSGIASGLDTEAIINALVAIERRPIQLWQVRRSQTQSKSTEFGRFKNLLSDLDSVLNGLKRDTDFYSFKASSSDEKKATASASNTAVPGSHSLEVLSLATYARIGSAGVADKTSVVGSGLIEINFGGKTTSLELEDASLEDISNAINGAGIGVRASIINNGSSGTPYQLVLSSEETGSANQLLTTQVDLTNFTPSGEALNFSQLTNAQDASILLDGIAVTSGTNIVSEALEGVTFNLLDESAAGESVTITIKPDTAEIANEIERFVSEFNEVITFIKKNTNHAAEGDQPVLFGDSMLRNARQSLVRIATGTSISANSGFENLSAIGIKLGADGKLSVDRSKLEEKIAAEPGQVAQIFGEGADAGATQPDGLAYLIQDYVDSLTDAQNGLISSRVEMLDSRVRRYDKNIEDAEARLESFEERQRERFAGFETLMGGLQQQQYALQSVFFPSMG